LPALQVTARMTNVRDRVAKVPDADLLRGMIGPAAGRLMELEVGTVTKGMAAGQDGAAAAELTVIVVSYNTRALTLAALRTLMAGTRRTAFRCVVFDNASSDGSAAAVAAAFPEVELIASDENLGFARANNLVAAAARTEWLLLLNPDTEVQAGPRGGAVDALMDFARAHPQAGIWGGRTVFPDGRLNIASCWGRITPWSVACKTFGLSALFPRSEWLNPEAYGGWQRDSVREVDIVVGCFLLIRRALWQELGGFDLKYVMYGEEADLCLRARARGWRPMVTPDAQIMHVVGAASATRAAKAAMVMKARATLIRDHWHPALVPPGLGLMRLGVALRWLATRPLALSPRPAHRAAADRWAELWRMRRDWLAGYR
jgi:GT2 family glycosyltransferase